MKITKLITAVLVGCMLTVAFIACAGCTDDTSTSETNNDKPLIGTYVGSLLLIEMILDFHSDFTVDIIGSDLAGTVSKSTKKYWRSGDNEYSVDDNMLIQVSDDSNVISVTGIDGEGGSILFNKFSNYKIPTPSPTQTPVPTQAPVTSGSVGNFVSDTYGGSKCHWGVTECIMGKEANKIVAEGSKNNKVPESGCSIQK